MRQAIITRFIGPTNHKGSRIKATADAGTVIISWDYNQDVPANHMRAASALASKYGWLEHNQLIGGGMPSKHRDAYCFVQVPK